MSLNINGGSTSTYMQGWDAFKNPIVTTTQYATTTGGNTVVITVNEATKTELTTTNAAVNNTVYCTQPINSWVNNTPTKCDTTTFPNVITLDNGTGKVTLSTDNGDVQASFSCSTNATYGNAYLTSYTIGSMAKAIHDLIVGAVGGRTAPDSSFMNVYSGGYTLSTNIYTKNIIDLTPYSENSPSGNGWPIVLISPRHVMSATHVSTAMIGSTHTFTDKNGNQQTKTVTGYREIGDDITISYLDSVITGITPYSILPALATTQTKLPLAAILNSPENQSSSVYAPLPTGMYGFYVKQRYPFGGGDYVRQMQLGNYSSIVGNSLNCAVAPPTSGYSIISDSRDIRYPYNQWWTQLANGDSSSPGFLPTGLTTATGTPLTIYLGSTTLSINSVSYNITAINSAMNAIKAVEDTTTYALDQVNISQSSWWNSFTTY